VTAEDAIARYHDLLAGGLAEDSQSWLEEQTERRGLTFGGRPVCTVVRPLKMSVGRSAGSLCWSGPKHGKQPGRHTVSFVTGWCLVTRRS